jgi:DNA invertase Pin-like site-specific DNA recombinase
VAELKAAGCQRVFQDKISGARSGRKQLARLLAEFDDGDIVIVTRLDRLARSTPDLLNTLAAIGAANATFRSLHDARHAVQSADRDGPRRPGGVRAASDRRPHQRGPQAARAKGVRFGRPRKLTPHQTREALKRVESGESLREIALSFNVDHSTISRLKARMPPSSIDPRA